MLLNAAAVYNSIPKVPPLSELPPNPASRVLSKVSPVPHLSVPTDRQRPSTSGPSRSLARVASLAWRFANANYSTVN